MHEILEDRAVISLKGSDALKFIQNFSTNNIEKYELSCNYLLNNQGRYLFDFFAFKKSDDAIYLDCNKDQAVDLIKRLTLYKLRANVVITNESDDYIIVYSKKALKGSADGLRYSLQDPRFNKLGYRSLLLKRKADEIIDSDQVKNLYLEDKYQFTIIDGYLDLTPEKSIPIEFAGEEQNAINFAKGCYVGQEVISRAKYQGVVRKKIYKLDFGMNIALSLKLADIVDEAGDKLGIVCSNYNNLAIAQIREEKLLGLKEKRVIINDKIALVIDPEWKN